MFKKYKVCDCFLEIACYCLSIDTSFGLFKKLCLMHFNRKNGNSVFVTMNVSQVILQKSLFHLTV